MDESEQSPPSAEVPSAIAVGENGDMQFGIFSRRKPQNVIAGISSGVKSAAKGTLAGIASVIAVPVITAHEEGAKSIPKGILKGVVTGTGLALGGIGVGLSQFVRGVGNTPEAISEMCKGKKRWDQETRRWVQDDLEADKIAMLSFGNDDDIYAAAKKRAKTESSKPEEGPQSDKQVADMTLYNELGIPSNATDSDIKKAYYRKASVCHPDKDPSPNAKERFQKLSSAYQILSNPDKRHEYDTKGKAETSENNDMGDVGADVLFTAVFGSEAFIPYIGKLQLAQMFMQDHSFSKTEARELQRRRGIRIAVHLSSLLRPFCDGHVDAWKESMQITAKELTKATFGDRLLLEIGKAYQLEARRHQGIISSSIATVEGKADNIRSYGKIASHGYATLAYMKKAHDGQAASLTAMEDSKSRDSMFELALEGTVIDISNILYVAADRLFHDNVESEVKAARVEGLLLLGGIFVDVATQALRSTSQNIESVLEKMPTIIAKKREEQENHMS